MSSYVELSPSRAFSNTAARARARVLFARDLALGFYLFHISAGGYRKFCIWKVRHGNIPSAMDRRGVSW